MRKTITSLANTWRQIHPTPSAGVQSITMNDEWFPARLTAGTTLNQRYRIERILSQEMNNSYLATDFHTGDAVVLRHVQNNLASELSLSNLVLALWQVESTLYQAAHPSIPRFLEVFTAQGSAFLVRSYIPGLTLEELSKPVAEPALVSWLQDILAALTGLHQQGLYHDNIAPKNIVISSQSNRPVLINFSCVDVLIERITQQDTSTYPSEAFTNEVFVSDLYPLAVLAVSLLTQVDFHSLMTTRNWIECWEKEAVVTPGFAEVLNHMLHLSAARPYKTASDCTAALRNLSRAS